MDRHRGSIRRVVEHERQAGHDEQSKWQRRQQECERDPTGQEEQVVFGTVVPDAPQVIRYRSAE
jgi:hypothetical protein